MKIIDTHLHLVYRDRFSYPWLEGVPPLNRDFHFADYRSQAEAAGIESSIHMEVDVAEKDLFAETDFVTTLDKSIVGAIAACRPESPVFPGQLEKLGANPKLRGLRRILHTSPDELSQKPIFAENLRRLAQHSLTFDLCVMARQIPLAIRLAQVCPDVQFILDHCGIPKVKDRELDPWRARMTEIATLPNVACKISGIIAYGDPPTAWRAADLRPYIEHCITAFGWDRVVWGSDWPVCTLTADLGRWVAVTQEIVKGASADEQAKLFHRNAARLYRLP